MVQKYTWICVSILILGLSVNSFKNLKVEKKKKCNQFDKVLLPLGTGKTINCHH